MAKGDIVFEDSEPTVEWARAAAADTLIVYLPGFNKEQLKVQVTTARNLRLSGERPIDGKKWSRFRKEIQIPSNCDTNGISAKFEKGILYVKHPKKSVPVEPAQESTQPPVEPPRTLEKVQPPSEASIPGPKTPTVQGKLEPSAEAPPRSQDQSTEAKTPQQEKVQPPPEASIPGPKTPTVQGKLRPSAEAPPRPQDQSTEAKTPQQEKVQPPPEASIPGPKTPTVQGKLEPSAEAPPRPQDQSTEAKTPQQEKVQPPPEAAVPLKPPQEKGQPSREPSNSRPEEKPSAEKDMDCVKRAGKIKSGSGGFKRESFRIDYGGLLMELKESRKLINLVLGISLVVVAVLYAMTALRSPSKSED